MVGAWPAGLALKALLGLNQAQLETWAKDQGLPAFRGRQLHDWLYDKGAREWQDITVLPAALREQAPLPLGRSAELERYLARDGTLKLLLAPVMVSLWRRSVSLRVIA